MKKGWGALRRFRRAAVALVALTLLPVAVAVASATGRAKAMPPSGRVIEPICFEEGKIYWLQQLVEEQVARATPAASRAASAIRGS